jgi:hypothetical protein
MNIVIVKYIWRFFVVGFEPNFSQFVNHFVWVSACFFESKKPMSLVQKLGPIPCAHYTFPNVTNLMGTKFYNILKWGSIWVFFSIL